MGMFEWVDPAREWFKGRPEAVKGLLGAVYQMATDPQAREAAMARYPVFDRSQSGQQMMDNALNAGPSGLLGKIVYHGSPHKFDKFDASKIGTGEGAQAYGHGVYLADSPEVAGGYARALGGREFDVGGKKIYATSGGASRALDQQTMAEKIAADALDDAFNAQSTSPAQYAANYLRKQAKYYPEQKADIDAAMKVIADWQERGSTQQITGQTYKADLPDEWIPKMLDWDKPLAEQAPEVRAALQKLGELMPDSKLRKGSGAMGLAESRLGSKAAAAQALREAGIPGIRYLDGGSRSAGQGSYNYVVFPGLEDKVKILERNGIPLEGMFKMGKK